VCNTEGAIDDCSRRTTRRLLIPTHFSIKIACLTARGHLRDTRGDIELGSLGTKWFRRVNACISLEYKRRGAGRSLDSDTDAPGKLGSRRTHRRFRAGTTLSIKHHASIAGGRLSRNADIVFQYVPGRARGRRFANTCHAIEDGTVRTGRWVREDTYSAIKLRARGARGRQVRNTLLAVEMEICRAGWTADAKMALLQGSRRAHRAMHKDTVLPVKDSPDRATLLIALAIFSNKEVLQRDGTRRYHHGHRRSIGRQQGLLYGHIVTRSRIGKDCRAKDKSSESRFHA
jgi:hypothetical protein